MRIHVLWSAAWFLGIENCLQIKQIKWKLKNNICITPTIDKLSLVALLKTATAATANQISATLPNTNLQVSLLNPYSLPISSHIYIANMFRNLHMNKLDSNTACGSWLGHLFNASPKNQLIRNENIQTKKMLDSCRYPVRNLYQIGKSENPRIAV